MILWGVVGFGADGQTVRCREDMRVEGTASAVTRAESLMAFTIKVDRKCVCTCKMVKNLSNLGTIQVT